MEEKEITIISFTTTSITCPCGKTRFQIPNAVTGYTTDCTNCGREFTIVTKVRISRPSKKRISLLKGVLNED